MRRCDMRWENFVNFELENNTTRTNYNIPVPPAKCLGRFNDIVNGRMIDGKRGLYVQTSQI